MKINYTDEAIITPFTTEEINEQISRMLAFCRINGHSEQINDLKDNLLKLEDALADNKFQR